MCSSLSLAALAQTQQTPMLKQRLAQATTDTSRVLLMADLSASYRYAQPDSALWYGQQGETLARGLRYAKGESQCLAQQGLVLSEKGDLTGALSKLLHAQGLCQITHDPLDLAQVLQTIGYLYISFPDDKHAKAYLLQAKGIYDQQPAPSPESVLTLASLGYAYRYKNQFDSARYYLQTAYQQGTHLRAMASWGSPVPYILRELGILAAQTGQKEQALRYLRQGKNLALANNNQVVYTRLCNTLSGLFMPQQPDSAMYYARIALQTAQKTGLTVGVLKNSQLLARYFKARQQTDSALRYTELMITANDSLYSRQRIKQLESINIEEQQRRRWLEGQKARFENQVRQLALLSGVSVLLVISLILWRNYRRQRKANALLTGLNEQIEQQKTELTHQRDDLSKALTELQTTQSQLIHAEKMASLGELTAGIAHEIQNPLNFVNNFSEVSTELLHELQEGPLQQLPNADREYADEIMQDLTQNLKKINQHGNRASSIVKGMLEHSRTSTGQRELTDINALADEYLRLAYHGLRAKDKSFNCTLDIQLSPELGPINVVPQDLGRVFLNLFNNAFYAVKEQQARTSQPLTPYQPTVSVTTQKQKDRVVVTIADNGTGISDALKEKIFQPFFTTKPTGEGTGLGLSLSYDIVTKGHGGTLTLDSTEGKGTKFTLVLPVA